MKSARNKTIDFALEEGQQYLNRCLRLSAPSGEILDKTILGDTMHVMPLLCPKSVDLMIADPPYNLYKDFGGNSFRKMDQEAYRGYTRAWIVAAKRLLKDNGSIYVCCDWQCSNIIGEILSEFFIVRNRITWQREKGRGAAKNWKNSTEDIWFATVSEDYTFNLDDVKVRKKVIAPYRENGKPKDWEETEEGNFRLTCPGNFWDDITVPYWSMPENTAHPTQKPEKLLAKLILASSNEGDLVFDPFLGSGSTSVTAKKLGRHYLGIEQNPQYCAWAEYRLEKADADQTIQGYENGRFKARNER